jgi:repressor LexA
VTERQKLVFDFIDTYIKMKGFAPSISDIATGLNMKSRANIHRIVHILRDNGLIKMSPRRSRTIQVVDKGVREIASL